MVANVLLFSLSVVFPDMSFKQVCMSISHVASVFTEIAHVCGASVLAG